MMTERTVLMKRCLSSLLLLLIAALPYEMASGATNIYVGGDGDEYQGLDVTRALAWPAINNAGGATGATTDSAWFNGTLLSTGEAPTTVHVYWGEEDGTNNPDAWDHWTNFNERTKGTLTTNVTGLAESTWHYYRFYATNVDTGVWASPSVSFKTYGGPTVDNLQGAGPVGETTATLNGRLTKGVSAQVTIYCGLATNNWSHTNVVGTVPEGGFSASVSGLTPGTNYFYRCYATNAYGNDWADSATNFMTAEAFLFFVGGDGDEYDGQYTNTLAKTGQPFGTVFIFR